MTPGELLSRIQEVCPLPATAQRVAQLASDPKAKVEQVATVLATDPALAAEVMRIANGAGFGRTRQVSELAQAVLLIGLVEIQRMAAAMAMLATFRTKHELTFNFHDKAVLAGSVARSLATSLGVPDRGEAFLCGLLSEIGAMACAAVDAEGYLGIWQATRSDPAQREAAEMERYGAPSRVIAAGLLRRNDLPEKVALAIEGTPGAADATPLSRLTVLSRRAAAAMVDTKPSGDATAIGAALGALREELAVPLPADDLVRICLEAAGTALSALRRSR